VNLKSIYRLKIWEEKRGRVRRILLRKPIVIAGSDRKADVVLKGLPGLALRIDFLHEKIYILGSDSKLDFAPRSIVSYEGHALTWRAIPVGRLLQTLALGGLGLMLSGFALSSALHKRESCVFAPSDSSRSFEYALKREDFAKAFSEMRSLKEEMKRQADRLGCEGLQSIRQMEEKFAVSRFLVSLQKLSLNENIEAFQSLNGISQIQRDLLEKRIIERLKERYLEAYRLEDEDDRLAFEMILELQEACRVLKKNSECYRPSGK